MKRFGWFAAPVFLLLLLKIAPLASGQRTLFLRDVLNAHLPLKQAGAEALRSGYLPLVDRYRGGGQPLLGNPNALPLYPDNLLYLLAPSLWALNAHFWIHWAAALLAMTWLARSFGLSREAAFAAGACYAFSGYFFSQLNFYNLIASAALAPALIAAALRLGQCARRRFGVALALLWALLCLGGEPIMAVLVWVVAVTTFLWAGPSRAACWILTVGTICGTLIALPQIVEVLRILPLSLRGHAGTGAASLGIGSFDPRQAAEWLLPFLFGLPDRHGPGAFWGMPFYENRPALLFTLYPGLSVLALASAALPAWRCSRAVLWALGACAFGLLLALGRHHPLALWLLSHGGGLLRYTSKFILPAAIGLSLLAGIGFDRALFAKDAAARRWLRASLGFLALTFTVGFGVLWFRLGGTSERLRAWIPPSFADSFVEGERLRFVGLCLVSLLVVAAAAAAAALAAKYSHLGGSAYLAVHVGSQLLLLSAAIATDDAAAYSRPPTLLAAIPLEARSVHGSYSNLFGPYAIGDAKFPSPSLAWWERRALAEMYPFFGPRWGRRFELNTSPDELDAFLTAMARSAVEQNPDQDRLRLLRGWGVTRLILNRELGPEHAARVRLLLREEHFERSVFVYEVLDAAPEVSLAGSVLKAPDLLAAFAAMTHDDFDAKTAAVIRGEGPPEFGVGGEVLATVLGAESLEATVRAKSNSMLVWQRSHLPIYLAAVDGKPAEIQFANFHRMGVAVAPGQHVVRIWADRRPLHWSLLAALIGILGTLALATGRPRWFGGVHG